MLETIDLVSIIIPVCNQGDEARETVSSAREAIAGMPHEIILVDDQSVDGSCHGMPQDVLIVRTERRQGVSAARRLGFQHSRGNIIIWSDPHCRFPARSLRHLAKVASYKDAVVQPKSVPEPGARVRFGGRLQLSERGLRVARSYNRPAPFPALYGTVYAMKRWIYERVGGWPRLPGVWGYSEQALSLMCWFLGVPVYVETAYTCMHKSYHQDRKFPFSVHRSDPAGNAHYVLALFFPQTYESYWRPMLEEHFGAKAEYLPPVSSREFRALRLFIKRAAVRSESDFFQMQLDQPMPKPQFSEDQYIHQQARRSKPGKYKTVRPRVDLALEWMCEHLPDGALAEKRALDLGTRDGYGVEVLQRLGAGHAEGVELVPETAARANGNGIVVRQGNMQSLPDPDASWDLLTSLHSLEHCTQPEKAVAEMARILRPGGWAMIVVPCEESTRDTCHNCCFSGLDALKEMVLAEKVFDRSSIQKGTTRQRRGRVELRLLVQKSTN